LNVIFFHKNPVTGRNIQHGSSETVLLLLQSLELVVVVVVVAVVKVKVKQSRYRPGVPQRVPGS
jgi:hypothetical protein